MIPIPVIGDVHSYVPILEFVNDRVASHHAHVRWKYWIRTGKFKWDKTLAYDRRWRIRDPADERDE